MSIFNYIKRSFGFGDNYDSEETYYDNEPNAGTESSEENTYPVTADKQVADNDESLSGDIFLGVIELFNKTQPEFVRNCLSTETQKEYILNNISSALKKRLENEVNAAKARGQMQWEEEMKKLDKEVENLHHEIETLEHKREESKSQKLSAERQKRALIERVRDLESQVLNLEADKEQYMLENRSMLNKLRVASITSGGASDEAVDEITRLTEKLENVCKEKETATLDAEHYKAIADTHVPVMETLLGNISDLVDDLLKAKEEKNRLKKKISSLLSIQDCDVREIANLKELIREKDSALASLKKELENERTRSASDDNSGIAGSPAEDKPMPEKDYRRGRKKKTPRISAIDELLESTDWFVAPSLPESKTETPEKNDDDFGYKAPPPRKSHPDDDKQLLLW